ncbi:MAG: potassium-transporting ATPase subunit KdpC [Mixta calida]|uniref:potassium-transporting ATPase subunit KdpC n=2 Tax=Erwiniaceae TaxID=1903409 RepID=UPI000535BB25|nr:MULTISPECIES: potassium-transporting ATPase subunit KdpC [Mixta]AIX75506.1 potassium-transporting ATPase subunit C [Pantoea sp. PSNIH2]MBS6058582.1 potassium-transporting ATPase subunit KdpC [Pantoea sp.]POU49875.1 potassium-transporting ATPase subunit KdpC [Pantoea sp. PSNIH5]POU69294.1 potassium-transporting ATPase subunit KdpC [Pantoea sp. PSNIH4]POY65390.1 potassium-transporting ATPase subunit KdpC [Pantoea sp. PSNIH3]
MYALRPALTLLILLTLLTGGLYPLLTTQLAQWLFPAQANGSLLQEGAAARGSALIGQAFSRNDYFWGRPSATAAPPYNGAASSGSNLAASNPALDQAVSERVALLRAANPQASRTVPVDLVTASGSGLDPHISPAAAQWQAPRVAAARRLPLETVQRLIEENSDRPLLKFLGEPGVNVVKLNMALDALTSAR